MHKATLPVVFLLLTAAMLGCEPRRTADDRPVHCTVVVDGPREKAEKISARARFRCDLPGAEKLTLAIALQRRKGTGPGENWHTVTSKTFTVRGADTTVEQLFDYRSREVWAACAAGVYRTVVDWSRLSRADTTGDHLVSGLIPNPCR